ncbi:GNAT family N-acetyltransferase [Flavobacterium sp.]|jgi:ribosomal protein S18 acetylase RimI-like enzyme|uniref:GNAT family N-acetyltransferase n=1 Tax=Flavobacterium sp. TaxID=239 RepID=UPI0025CF9315|nr:GNAT family N-acetyltransferase [Flavobacterium sp.]
MNRIEITKISLEQLVQLQEIGRLTFAETFSSTNSEENMKTYLEEGFSIEKLTAELQNPASEFYFATLNEVVIGYLKINFGQAQTEVQEGNSLEIERIYVLQDFHGKKVGQLLYEKAIQIAKNKKVAFVWLGVWEENHRAIQFYTKNGFVAFDQHIFRLGDDEQTDIMMKLKIVD